MRKTNRIIPIRPDHTIWYLIDSNFLVNRFLDPSRVTDSREKEYIIDAHSYWSLIMSQVKKSQAKILILDVCIAEAFKTLAKKYYRLPSAFRSGVEYNQVKNKLSKEIHLTTKEARLVTRNIKFHDIQTNRDIIIGVDRFFEKSHKLKTDVSIVDLMILSTAKYLVDFYGFSHNELFIITQDGPLHKLARKLTDVPPTFHPSVRLDNWKNVFV